MHGAPDYGWYKFNFGLKNVWWPKLKFWNRDKDKNILYSTLLRSVGDRKIGKMEAQRRQKVGPEGAQTSQHEENEAKGTPKVEALKKGKKQKSHDAKIAVFTV